MQEGVVRRDETDEGRVGMYVCMEGRGWRRGEEQQKAKYGTCEASGAPVGR